MEEKKCISCGKFKELKEFELKYRSKKKKDINFVSSSACRTCRNRRNHERKKHIRREFSARGLYKGINKGRWKRTFTRDQFLTWFNNLDSHNCHYCGVTHKNYFKKKIYKKYSGLKTWIKFTLDRKDSFKDYTLKNICISCPLCNYVKGYIFNYEDFKEISKKFIKPLY